MITKFHLRDFKGHRSTNLSLARFTVLVGDNASGKTSVLDALSLQAAMSAGPVSLLQGDHAPADLLRRDGSIVILESSGIRASKQWHTVIELRVDPTDNTSWSLGLTGELDGTRFDATATGTAGGGTSKGDWPKLASTLGTAGLYRLRPDRVAAAAYSGDLNPTVAADGTNTAVVLETMKLGNDELFARIEDAMRRLIPTLRRVRLRKASIPSSKFLGTKIYFDFDGAADVPAHCASHGTLIVLSLLAVLHGANRPSTILLDDFDHALHPRAQMALVRMIQELLRLKEFADLQIVATTHSPYVLDEFEPADVHAFALQKDGTVVTKPLSEHPEAQKMNGALRTGQLWTLDPEREWVLQG
jgi:predicted ATPase